MQSLVTEKIRVSLKEIELFFQRKPIVIGGMAMEYYGMRKAGADIDLVIPNEDYLTLAKKYPDQKKDIYGDLGLVINEFEIWRSIALLDYDFLLKDAIEEENVFIVSLDRLLLMRVCAMDVAKYRTDLETMKAYYYEHFRNQKFLQEANSHDISYKKSGGIIFGGQYLDDSYDKRTVF